MRRILLAGGLFLAAAISAAQAQNLTRRYICADGTAFFARPQPHAMVLDFGGGMAQTLASRPEAGPGVFGMGDNEFRLRSDGATLARGGQPPVACRGLDVHDLPLPPFE